MRILLLSGNHPRHLYFANAINKKYPLAGLILQERENILPVPPKGIGDLDKKNFVKHFKNRAVTELKYFGEQKEPACRTLKVIGDSLSAKASVDFVKGIKPEIVFIFGTDMVREPLFSSLPKYKINLHLGLSPWYRGSATLFWPFYFLEPNFAGSTFHLITGEPDAGNIIHQVLPSLSKTDCIHDVACKTVTESSEEVIRLIKHFKLHHSFPLHQQTQTGKNFLTKDFKPEHLRVIYNLYKDNLVEQYLNGKLKCRQPSIIKL